MPSARLESKTKQKYQFCKSFAWLDPDLNFWPSARETCAVWIRPPPHCAFIGQSRSTCSRVCAIIVLVSNDARCLVTAVAPPVGKLVHGDASFHSVHYWLIITCHVTCSILQGPRFYPPYTQLTSSSPWQSELLHASIHSLIRSFIH